MTTKIDDALVERMVAHIRAVEKDMRKREHPGLTPLACEALAIASMLPPPVDPDLIEARKINHASPYDITELSNPRRIDTIEQVERAILRGIKRGRELAAQ